MIDNKTCIKNVINQYDTNYIYNENIIDSTDNLNSTNSNKTNIDIKDNNDIIETMINISYLNNDFNMNYKINELLNNECNISLSIEKIIEQIRNSIKNNEINELLEEIINNKKDFTKKIGNITIQLISLENQDKNKKENISIIDFRECEDILRINYGLENNSILLYKIDIPIIGYHTMVVEYELYNTKNFSNILNLDYCKKSSINIHIPVIVNENEIIKYNPSSKFYNDICSPYTNENGADVILLDRKNEFINNNLTLCDDDCQFKEYDSINKKAICNCKIKNVMKNITDNKKIDSEKFFKDWMRIENIININIIKCIEILNNKDAFLKNIGNFILLSVLILFIISANYFYFKGFSKLTSIINRLKNTMRLDLREENVKKLSVIQRNSIQPKKSKKKKRNTISKRKSKNNKVNIKIEDILNKDNKKSKNLVLSKSSMINIINNDINLNTDITKMEINMRELNDYELNSLNYKDALVNDKRTYAEYYLSLIKTKQLLIFTFYFKKDYNSYIIKVQLFLFAISLYLVVSTLFFSDGTIHKIYENKGIFNFVYNIPQILYSTIISSAINAIVKELSLTESKILEIKSQKSPKKLKEKTHEIIKCLKLKFILFYIISFTFLIIFWIYISCFCAVYRNTQYHLIKDTMMSFVLSLLYPFGLNIIPVFIRMPAIRNKNQECLYKISKVVQLI